jgi:hypothetical protein
VLTRTIQLQPSARARSTIGGSAASIVSTNCTTSLSTSPGPLLNFTAGIGVVYINCTAIDTNAIATSCLFSTYIADLELPRVTCPATKNLTTNNASSFASTTAQATASVDSRVIVVAASDNDPTTLTFNPFTVFCNASALPANTRGVPAAHTVVCTAVDPSGNGQSCAMTVFVRDVEAPVLSGNATRHVASSCSRLHLLAG